MTPIVERKYAMSRIAAGDYVLPSNDGETLWRVVRYTDGPSSGLDHMARDRDFWALWKWPHQVSEGSFIDLQDWDRWECVEDMFESRAAAIDRALS